MAVHEIVDKKLYKVKSVSLETYFRGCWKISRAQVYRFLDCVTVLETLGDASFPCRERLCRSLRKVAKSASELKICWDAVLAHVNYDQEAVTSAIIEIVWEELLENGTVQGIVDESLKRKITTEHVRNIYKSERLAYYQKPDSDDDFEDSTNEASPQAQSETARPDAYASETAPPEAYWLKSLRDGSTLQDVIDSGIALLEPQDPSHVASVNAYPLNYPPMPLPGQPSDHSQNQFDHTQNQMPLGASPLPMTQVPVPVQVPLWKWTQCEAAPQEVIDSGIPFEILQKLNLALSELSSSNLTLVPIVNGHPITDVLEWQVAPTGSSSDSQTRPINITDVPPSRFAPPVYDRPYPYPPHQYQRPSFSEHQKPFSMDQGHSFQPRPHFEARPSFPPGPHFEARPFPPRPHFEPNHFEARPYPPRPHFEARPGMPTYSYESRPPFQGRPPRYGSTMPFPSHVQTHPEYFGYPPTNAWTWKA